MKKFLGKIGNFFKNCFHKIGGFFSRLGQRISKHKLFVLVMMQLKDKWNISFKTNKKAALFKLVAYVFVFAAITALVYLIMFVSTAKLAIFITPRIPLNAMFPIFLVVVLLEGVSILIGITNALFFSKDNVVLITYPVKSDYLFLSKVIVYYLDALKKSLSLLVPIFISFAIIYKFPVYYFFLLFLFDFIFVGVVVLMCSLLAIPTYYVVRFLNRFQIIKILFSVAVLGFAVFGAIKLINIIPGNINLIRQYENFSKSLTHFLYWFENHFFVTVSLGHMFFGMPKGLNVHCVSIYTWAVPLALIGALVMLFFGNKYLSKPFYNKIIATSNRNKVKKPRDRKNVVNPKWLSILHYEFLRNFRDQKVVVNSIICIVVMPLIIMITNKFYGAISTRFIGNVLILAFNILFIMLVVVSHNTTSSYVFSKDGPSWNVNKTMPADPRMSLAFRLVYNFIVSILIIVPSSIILFKSEHMATFSAVMFIFTLIVLSTIHSFWSASYDFSHSENKDKADIGSEIISSHSVVSIAFGLIIGALGMLFIILLYLKGSFNPQLRTLLLSIAFLALEVFYFIRKVHLSYQEN